MTKQSLERVLLAHPYDLGEYRSILDFADFFNLRNKPGFRCELPTPSGFLSFFWLEKSSDRLQACLFLAQENPESSLLSWKLINIQCVFEDGTKCVIYGDGLIAPRDNTPWDNPFESFPKSVFELQRKVLKWSQVRATL